MKPRTSNQILDEIVEQHTRKDINLSSSILTKVRKENNKIMKSKFVLSSIFAAVIIFVIVFSIPSVANAMKRLLGFIPGAGLVENNSALRVLKESVQIRHADTTITVKQGVVDTQQTTLVYQVENIPASPATSDIQVQDMCHQLPELLLPNGNLVQGQVVLGNSWVSGYSRRIVFPVLPNDVNTVKLVFSCLEQTFIMPDSQKMEVILNFVEAPANMTIYPLVDFPTPTPAPTLKVSLNPTQPETGEASYASSMSLVVRRYVQTDENLILLGSLESQSGNIKIEAIDGAAIHLLDASGKDIPLEEDSTLNNPEVDNSGGASFQWAYRTADRYTPGQATLIVDSVWVGMAENIQFTFDPGTNPKPEQKWVLNQQLVIDGRTINIQSAQMNKTGDGVSFTVVTPNDISGVTLQDPDHALLGGGGGPNSYGFTYRDGFPSGKIQVVLTRLSVNIPGPWETRVDLPTLENGGGHTELLSACLTQSSWQTAIKNPSLLPDGLGGLLAISNILESDHNYHVMTANLDGTNLQMLAAGDGISLSPDSRQIIYNSDTGLQKMDLGSGVSTPLLDSGRNDRGALWSPDGTKIAFTRGPASGLIGAPGPYSLFIANPDGSQQQPMLANADANTVQAWLPDGQSLLYTVKGPEGASLRSVNITTGQVTSLFQIHYTEASVAVSPDGKQVMYEEMLPGDHYGMYMADLDGSNPKLIVDAAPIVVTIPQWSPDGKWVIVSVHDEQFSPDMPVLALVKVDTCQIIPLTSLKGYVSTWNK